jgi:hypothetical protein
MRRKNDCVKGLYCFIIALCLTWGCQTSGGPERVPSKPEPVENLGAQRGEIPFSLEAKGAMAFVKLLEERASGIHSLHAQIALSVSGKEIPSYKNLNGILIASLPGRYRVTAYSPEGKAIFDFLTLPEMTALRWAPTGSENLSIEAGFRRRPYPGFMENLSLVMGAGPFPKPGIALDNRVNNEIVLYLLEQLSAGGVLTRNRRIRLGGKDVLVTRIEEFDSDRLAGRLEMADYRAVNSHWIPHRLLLSYRDLLLMEINVKSISLNAPVDEGLFEPNVTPADNFPYVNAPNS